MSRMKVFDAYSQTVSIYGLFNQIGKCVYVGQALEPQQRAMRHRKTKNFSYSTVLRRCKIKEAGRIEQQVISAYKRRGECDLNKSSAVVCYKTVSNLGSACWIPIENLYFNSREQALKRGEYHCISLQEPFKRYQYDPDTKTGKWFARWLKKHIENNCK